MLNSRGKRGHPCVVLDLSGKASSLSLLSMSFAKGFCRVFGGGVCIFYQAENAF